MIDLVFHERKKEFDKIKRGEITCKYVPIGTKLAEKINDFCSCPYQCPIAWAANGKPSALEDERWQKLHIIDISLFNGMETPLQIKNDILKIEFECWDF